MSEQLDENLQAFLEIRQPGDRLRGAHPRRLRAPDRRRPHQLQEVPARRRQRDLQEGRPRRPRRDRATPSVELPDYSGPFRADLRFSDFSKDALVRMIGMSYAYYIAARRGVGRGARSAARAKTRCRSSQTSAWTNGILPHVDRIKEEWSAFDGVDEMPGARHRRRRSSARSSPIRATRSATRSGSSTCSSAATSSCCSSSRRGPPRSWCGTRSTRCSTSSGRSGATRCCPRCATSRAGG